MATTSDIKNGFTFKHNNDIFTITEFQHVKPGKGPAFVRTKFKSLSTGRVLQGTFPSGHKIEEVRVERHKMQFLYKDDFGYHFMNNESFEQAAIADYLIDNPGMMFEGDTAAVLDNVDDNIPLTVGLTQYIEMDITHTESGVRGLPPTHISEPTRPH